jgi:16S rRNA (cytidine1402-2'-O)-methyltransferase
MAGGNSAYQRSPLAPGLYLVSTPIGSARDITLRALDVLASADVLAAEDTRTLRHLMEIHGLPLGDRQIYPCHDHNEAQVSPRILQAIAEGKSVAYASEAGTPMISDPGFPLARAAIAKGLPVTAAPGPSAAICALTLAGLPTDRFLFAGFAPSAKSARRSFLAELAPVEATLVLYESPKRVNQILEDCCEILGEGRKMALCRELTKRFEEVIRGTVAEVRAAIAGRDLKGEIVLVIGRGEKAVADAATIEAALDRALQQMTVKDAAAAVAEAYGLPRRELYQLALQRGKA